MHFGTILIELGVATSEQVLAALDDQRKNRPFVGQIAIRDGLLDALQVLDVLDRARSTGLSFGRQAMHLGYLAIRDYERLGFLQRRSYEPLGEILVRHGVLAKKKLPEYLHRYFRHQEEARKQFLAGLPSET